VQQRIVLEVACAAPQNMLTRAALAAITPALETQLLRARGMVWPMQRLRQWTTGQIILCDALGSVWRPEVHHWNLRWWKCLGTCKKRVGVACKGNLRKFDTQQQQHGSQPEVGCHGADTMTIFKPYSLPVCQATLLL
jgi:hypothetical protein